jgi:hypothetical protein
MRGILILLLAIVVPAIFAVYALVRNRRPYPSRGRKLGGEYTNNEPLVELNISGTAFPEDPSSPGKHEPTHPLRRD